jgi:hypothetical protein
MPFQSDKRLYLTADDQVVEEGDERAVSLLVGAGGQLSDAQAAKYGLGRPREATPQASPKSDVPAAESADGSASAKSTAAHTKAVAAPEGNK